MMMARRRLSRPLAAASKHTHTHMTESWCVRTKRAIRTIGLLHCRSKRSVQTSCALFGAERASITPTSPSTDAAAVGERVRAPLRQCRALKHTLHTNDMRARGACARAVICLRGCLRKTPCRRRRVSTTPRTVLSSARVRVCEGCVCPKHTRPRHPS